MKKLSAKYLLIVTAFFGWLTFGSWSGGPAPECMNDSLAIIRVVKPMNKVFKIKPVVFVSKGLGRIDQVSVSDIEAGSGDFLLKQTLTNFLANGYTIQTATETSESGMQLNTYYLKKKVI